MSRNSRSISFFLFLFIQLFVFRVSAQDYAPPPNFNPSSTNKPVTPTSSSDSLPRFYLGFGTGINNYVGLIGPGAEVRIYKLLFIRAGVGVGTWGTKFTIGVKYALNPGKGWEFGLGYSYCMGLNNFQTMLQVDSANTTTNKTVTLNLNPASSLNLSVAYNWMIHNRHKFYLEFGYAVRLQSNLFHVDDGSVLTDISTTTIGILAPGGFIIDCGFMFKII